MVPRIVQVVFYRTPMGIEPVRVWLWSLDRDVQRVIGHDIDHVQRDWPDVGMPLVRPFDEGLFEVRSAFDGNIYRVLFCVYPRVIYLLHGFQKKTQKTPDSDIKTARKRQREGRR